MCTLWTLLLNLSIPVCPFQYCFQPSSGAGFRPSLQSSWSPLTFPFLFAVEELYGTRYQSGSFSLINVGSGFHCLRTFFFFLFFFSEDYNCIKPSMAFERKWADQQSLDCVLSCIHLRLNLLIPAELWGLITHFGEPLGIALARGWWDDRKRNHKPVTVKKPCVINAFLSFRNAFLNQKREREHFEAFQTVL